MAIRPVVLPDNHSSKKDWKLWIYHFENIATVNGWDDAAKLQWLKVRLTGRGRMGFQCFSDELKETYATAMEALEKRFEPLSRQGQYQAEFQTCRWKKAEGWADFAEELQALVNRVYPTIEEKGKEQLALNHSLGELENPQVAFSIKQQCPKMVEEAVTATLEMESYLGPKAPGSVGIAVSHQKTVGRRCL